MIDSSTEIFDEIAVAVVLSESEPLFLLGTTWGRRFVDFVSSSFWNRGKTNSQKVGLGQSIILQKKTKNKHNNHNGTNDSHFVPMKIIRKATHFEMGPELTGQVPGHRMHGRGKGMPCR